MIQSGFLGHRNFLWLKVNAALVLAMLAGYVVDQPIGGRNGGTWLGYAYGIFAALAIVYLTWFAIRKRSYYSTAGTVKGWLSLHSWLGIALIIVVPLHCGFSFGLNVHTLAFALMVIVTLSGIWGAFAYVALAPRIESHRGGVKANELREKIERLSREIGELAPTCGEEFERAQKSTKPGDYRNGVKILFQSRPQEPDRALLGRALSSLPEGERPRGEALIARIGERYSAASQLYDESRVLAMLRVWIFIHAPLAAALLAALAAHIIAVFYFR